MTLLTAIQNRRSEVIRLLTAEFRKLGSGAEAWVMAQDGPLMLVEELTGIEVGDRGAEEVFTLLDSLCWEAGYRPR